MFCIISRGELTEFTDVAGECYLLGSLYVVQSHTGVIEVLGLPGERAVLRRVGLSHDQLSQPVTRCKNKIKYEN